MTVHAVVYSAVTYCSLPWEPLNMDAMACKALRATFKCHLKYVDLDVDKQSSEG
jgi:hypothetical protein